MEAADVGSLISHQLLTLSVCEHKYFYLRFSWLFCAFLFSRNPISCRGPVPEVFNREELLCLPAGTAEFQHLIQRHPQSLD